MKNKKLITSLIIIALVIGAVMIFKSSPDKPEVITDYHSHNDHDSHESHDETPVAPGDKVVAAPKAAEGNSESLPLEIEALPTIADMRQLSHDEVHHTPEAVLKAAGEIADMIDAAEKNPELREKTSQFLLKCSETENVVNSIRAICWNQTLKAVKDWKVFLPLSEAKVPANVKDLAQKLVD